MFANIGRQSNEINVTNYNHEIHQINVKNLSNKIAEHWIGRSVNSTVFT